MKTIKDYIQFAINNGLEKGDIESADLYIIIYKESDLISENTIELITSKPFIEAIARGIYGNIAWLKYKNKITNEQAIAIRDNKLEEFITNL